ncbi:3-deoxy-manno-octulosonate-8-phosphatase KdsC [Paraferrimonas sp. SM1919]|uniref:3-deoxy-manno-octulosonate-8-phosphatase KdsC n=1 Tax=Paraferrimonas sp. SM1919 TaxID=2662263 RepID=UPI0013D6E77D|nr:3-deoxy-manno-octulosonate-8-phosphatase KdsC [Paraferrimonas sp. SM1919]
MASTFYGEINEQAWAAAKKIKLLICDVDGVFSDGRIYMGNNGEELKTFHTRDGYGVKALLSTGIDVAIITGRKSEIVNNRMQALGIKHIYQGVDDKLVAYNDLMTQCQCTADEVAYIGDDLIDWPVMEICGLGVAVHDAHPLLKQNALYCTHIKGGEGAVRELCDIILLAQGNFEQAKGLSI